MYLSETYPQVSSAELDAWGKLSYTDLALQVLKKFAADQKNGSVKSINWARVMAQVV